MTSYSNDELLALDHVEDVLEAYADARLAPAGPTLARMRAHVLAKATTTTAIDAAAQRVLEAGDAKPSRWTMPRFAVPYRALTLAGTGLFAVGMTTAVLAAPAGSPFYEARVAIEAAFLPTQIDARLASHEEHLATRLAEAEVAAARGDAPGLEAALAAFQAEVDAAVGDVGESGDRLAHLEDVLARHVAKLEALAARLKNETASENALEHAIAASERGIERIQSKNNHGGGRPSDKPANPNKPGGE